MYSPVKFPLPSPTNVEKRTDFTKLSRQPPKRTPITFSPLSRVSSDIFSGSTPSAEPNPSPRRKFSTKDIEECSICSNQLFEVCHPHISTQQIESRFQTENYYCPICKKQHPKQSEGRRSLVLGSSTLHNIWKVSEYKPNFHVDFDCIIGGKIHDVHASFLYQYAKIKEPMDVLLACGVNNIPSTDSAHDIIFQFKSLVKSILQHSEDQGHVKPSRVVIASLLYAPKYCDARLNPQLNMIDKVRTVNKWIQEYNEKATGKQLDLHLHGVAGDPSIGDIKHRYEEWREPQWERKLHFTQEVKGTVAKDLIKVFTDLKWAK